MKQSLSILSLPTIFALLAALLSFNLAANTDEINSLSTQEKIGFEEVPVIYVDVSVSKIRQLHVAVVDMSTWQNVAKTNKRIKQSGNYHFELPIEGIKPGRYRVDAYLSPRGKGFADKITEPTRTQIQVIKKARFEKPSIFNVIDKVRQVSFPKIVDGNEDVNLKVQFFIKEPRDLHMKLLSSENWKEFGALKFPVNEPGEMSLPLTNMAGDFPAGKYAWVVSITEKGKTEPLAKMGKHFELKEQK